MFLLRTQPEVMIRTTQGIPDADIEATKKVIAQRLPPNDKVNFDFIICLAETGEMIGKGGSHKRVGELGWPVLGYMFRKEFWGQGYATEFLNGFLEAWWALPRAEVEVQVEKNTVEGDDAAVKEERIVAITEHSNTGSQNVVRKCGMKLAKSWEEKDLFLGGDMVTLHGFVAMRPVA